ncbi:MAG: cytochrome C oxidase subunit IV family protein [Gemmatimonadota bacterium]
MKRYVLVWLGLLLILAGEVALTFAHLSSAALLAALLALAFLEAGLALMYFMHLKYERRLLFWSLIPGLIFVLVMLNQLWFDAVRLRSLRP